MNFIVKNLLRISKRLAIIVALAVIGSASLFGLAAHALTGVQNPSPAARISFSFDDSLASTYNNAAPTLQQYGLTGTDYAITGCVGMTTVPNTCNANGDTPYMSWTQLQALQNTYGWEIGSHTVDHDCLASSAETDPDDCANAAPLTTAQVDAELANSKSALAANGINATDIAPPYGDFNNTVLAEISKYYASMRQFANAANNANVWPYSDYYLQNFTVLEKTDPVSIVETQINNAIANNQWLILTFHDIETSPSQNPDDYQYGTNELAQIAAYIQIKQAAGQIQSVHINQGLVTSATNLLSNGNFSAGISNGWTTDDPTHVTADSGNNGSYPNPTYSIKLTAPGTTTTTTTGGSGHGRRGRTTTTTMTTPTTAHLFSPTVSVDPNETYVFKDFLNVQSISSGSIGFYVDEYNSAGNWISGQYLKTESSSFVEDMNFTYKPTSISVAKARLQITDSGSGITAYVANSQMFSVSTSSVSQTNLMPDEGFDAGISQGWTTDDPTNITADSGNNGSPNSPVNSVKLIAHTATSNTHLFSPQIAVSSAHTYNVTTYLNLKALTSGEVGFYVDEYNAAGQWISGQYKIGVSNLGAEDVGFAYTPSSSSVAKASLQIIVVGNSGITAYADDVRWYQTN